MLNPGTTSRTGFEPILVDRRPPTARHRSPSEPPNGQRSFLAELSGAAVVVLALGGFMLVKTPRAAEGETNSTEMSLTAVSTGYRPQSPEGSPVVPDDARDVVQDGASGTEGGPGRIAGQAALKRAAQTLTNGIEQFQQIPGYEARFFKQERIDGVLSEDEEIQLKLAHAPFRVYMKWRSGEVGQQALYIDGEYDNQVLVQPGGLKGRLAGTLKMDPRDERAMASSRYPITNLGMVELAKLISAVLAKDLETGAAMTCQLAEDASYEGRPCDRFTATYKTPQPGHPYRKVEICIDQEYEMPVFVRTYGWDENGTPVPDEDSLLECYRYHEIVLYDEVPAKDFDPKNRKYALRLK